jgi:hypothetical protein
VKKESQTPHLARVQLHPFKSLDSVEVPYAGPNTRLGLADFLKTGWCGQNQDYFGVAAPKRPSAKMAVFAWTASRPTPLSNIVSRSRLTA